MIKISATKNYQSQTRDVMWVYCCFQSGII